MLASSFFLKIDRPDAQGHRPLHLNYPFSFPSACFPLSSL